MTAEWNPPDLLDLYRRYEAGESTTAITDRLADVLDSGYKSGDVQIPSSAARAQLIAQTETTASANGGALAVARSSGLDLEKEWVNRGDDKVRDSHQDQPVGVGGEVVALDGTFSNDAAYPGDGPPEEACNCRCTVLIYPTGTAGG